MSVEQGYFTRAKKSKFTGEAGFAVVDVSKGINKEKAVIYIQSVGETIVFDARRQDEKWVYAVLPSRREEKISVTYAFPTSDGQRACHFSHTYLFDEQSAKELLWNDMRSAKIARITGFCEKYIGEPSVSGLELAVPEYNENFVPENINFNDTGFTDEAMTSLLNLILLVHENRRAKPNPLRGIFIVYDCLPEEFEKKAFSLASLLYSCMPYDISSQLGVIIKTDAEWRKNESYSSGYSSAYMINPFDSKDYIPGGELYILNKPLSDIPAGVCVVTVKSGGVLKFSMTVDIPPVYKKIFEDMVNYMKNTAGKNINEKSKLHEFYKFAADIVGEVPPFHDMCNLYSLAEGLRDPAGAAKSGLKSVVRVLKLLNISMNKNFDKTDQYWIKQTGGFTGELSKELLNDKYLNDGALEEACILLLKSALELCSDTSDKVGFGFLNNNFYKILCAHDLFTLKNERLYKSLITNNINQLNILMQIDKINEQRFINLRDGLIERGNFDDIEIMLNYFDIYDRPLEAGTPLHERLYKIVSEFSAEQVKSMQNIINNGTLKAKCGVVYALAERLVEFKSYDTAKPDECLKYFRDNNKFIFKELKMRTKYEVIYDAAMVKFFIYNICEPVFGMDYNEVKKWFGIIYNGFFERNDTDALNSVKEFAQYMIEKRIQDLDFEKSAKITAENKYLFMLIKYTNFDKKLWSLEWGKFIDAIYYDFNVNGNISEFTKRFQSDFLCVTNDATVDYDTYLEIYKILNEKFLSPKTLNNSKNILISSQSIFKILNVYDPEEKDTEIYRQMRLLFLCLWGKASQIFNKEVADKNDRMKVWYCDNDCYCINTLDTERCPVCNKKISADNPYPLAELITVDWATLKSYGELDTSKENKKEKGGGSGTFEFKVKDNDTAELIVNGPSDKAAKFFRSLDNDFMERRKRTCLIIEAGENDKIGNILNYLTLARFSYLLLFKKSGKGQPIIENFFKRDPMYSNDNRRSMEAVVEYYEDNRPDEMIRDLAQGLARSNVIKVYYPYGY